MSRAALWCLGAVRADWRVEWGRRGLPEASRRTRPLVGNQGLYRPAEPKNKYCGSFAVRSQFRRTSLVSSACGCEAGGGEEKRKGSSSRTSSRVRAPKGERPNRCSEPRGCRPERTPKPNEPRVHRTSSRTSSPVRRRTRRAELGEESCPEAECVERGRAESDRVGRTGKGE